MNKCDYKKVDESLISNTDMKILLIDGVETSYYITPKEGFKLHAKELDSSAFDEKTMTQTDEIILGFTKGTKTCHISYDFEENPREFYTVEDGER
ncbi:MAG: hypothetical protein IKV88_02425 [Clostridia bacterium]|nr:hypothetical protein [Clostridia bacterium]